MYVALASGVVVLFALYFCADHWKTRMRRQRATTIIRRLEEALAGRGHVINFHWLAETEFEAALRFASSSFKRSSIRVEFSDSTLPLVPWSWRHTRGAGKTGVQVRFGSCSALSSECSESTLDGAER